MSDELDKLKQAMQNATPPPSDDARDRALRVAAEEFEKTFQGSPETVRPTSQNAPSGGFMRGAVSMFRRLTTREALLTTASVATVVVAVVVTQDFNSLPEDNHGKIIVGEFADTKVGATLQSPQTSTIRQDATSQIVINETAPAAQPLDDGFATGAATSIAGNEVVQQQAPVLDALDVTDQASSSPNTPLVDGRLRTESDGDDEIGVLSFVAPAAPIVMSEESEAVTTERRANVTAPTTSQGIVADMAATAEITIIQPAEPVPAIEANTELFPEADINPLKVASEEPVSTFSIDVDTASYGIVRSSLMNGQLPPRDAVRTEELINYFPYDYPLPAEGEAPFSTSVTVMDTPWNADTKLLHIGIQGFDIAVEDRPPVNLVFLIDTSGSMNDANKLPLLINSFRLMLANLQPEDQVAIVTYAGSAGMALEPTPASDSAKILASLQNLSAGGSTAGQAGLQQAYALAEQMADDGDISRVILATDGDFNVGISDPEKLQSFVEDKRDSGVYLSVLGFGRGNYNDTIMQTLAQNGNGTAAYIDTLAEAQKVLVDQIGGALFTIAQDVKIQIEFNPAEIAEYRLIGYETRALNREDFNNDAVDAGEIGAGHSVTAIYEITPVGSPAVSVDDLRYTQTDAQPASSENGEYAFLKLRYKNPGEDRSILLTTPVFADSDAGLQSEANFAAAVAGFAQLLRDDDRIRGWDIADAQALAQQNMGADPFGYRAELITLMRLADSLK